MYAMVMGICHYIFYMRDQHTMLTRKMEILIRLFETFQNEQTKKHLQ